MRNDYYYLPLGESERHGRLAFCACPTVEDARNFSKHVIARRFKPSRREQRYRIVELDVRDETIDIPDDPISPPAGATAHDEQWFTSKELYTRHQAMAIVSVRNCNVPQGVRFAIVELGRRCSMPFGFIEVDGNGMGVQERRFSTPVRLVKPSAEEGMQYGHRVKGRRGLLGYQLNGESKLLVNGVVV